MEYFYPRAHYDSATTTVQVHLYTTQDQSVVLHELDLESGWFGEVERA